MEKLSVKKPFTILILVIMILALGVQSVFNMTTDLLPEFDLPYMLVITPYPGASPERVETGVSIPLENALGTVSGVKNITSISYENYSLIQLEFEGGTNMDGALVRLSSAIDEAKSGLPESAMNSTLMEISLDMVATMYTAVSREGYDIYALSDYVRDDFVPYLERQDGVASVTTVGLVEKSIQVDLNKEKIRDVNDRILAAANDALAEAKSQLDQAESTVASGQAALEAQESSFGSTVSQGIFSQLGDGAEGVAASLKSGLGNLLALLTELKTKLDAASSYEPSVDDIPGIDYLSDAQREQLEAAITELGNLIGGISGSTYAALMQSITDTVRTVARIQAVLETLPSQIGTQDVSGDISNLIESIKDLNGIVDQAPALMDQLQSGVAGLTQAQLDAAVGFSTASNQLIGAQQQLEQAKLQFESSREEALKNANADALLTPTTLSQLIYAQNFSMPAGYIDDEKDNSWLLKVGEEYTNPEDLAESLLADIEGIGAIRLKDVADVVVIDNADDTYSNLNGHDGIILCIYKSSTAGTNEVSRNVHKAFEEIMLQDEGLDIVDLVDQGDYITLIIGDILTSIGLGALLAIIVLALFMRDVRPTLVVGISIPLSVLMALVLMYFSNLTLNMMTLSGMALGIGMLVDNSIVVMENIFRLRGKGIDAPRAAVQGALQVRDAIVASTLTTVCVFLPMIFTKGYVRQLLVPMALAIGYCLGASLVIALTVIPAASSTIMRNLMPKGSRTFDGILDRYGKMLRWCLNHKLVPLGVAIVLLITAVISTVTTGVVLIPDISSPEIQVEIYTRRDDTKEESTQKVDAVMEEILKIEGIEAVGIMDMASGTSLISSFGSDGSSYGGYLCYANVGENTNKEDNDRICEEIEAIGEKLDCNIYASSGSISDMTALGGSGITLNVYGKDPTKLAEVSGEVARLVESVEGFASVSDGSTRGTTALQLVIDKDKAMSYGITVAQIFAEISARMNTEVTSTTVTVDGVDMSVTIRNNTDPLTRENLLNMTFSTNTMAGTGSSGATDPQDPGYHYLYEFATIEEVVSPSSIYRENMSRMVTVTGTPAEGYNITLLARELEPVLRDYAKNMPSGYDVEFSGETVQINDMMQDMMLSIALAILFIYLVMVAQFQSLLSPFIILFTVPLAFTGGIFALILAGQPLSMLAMMGFLILMGTVVNNGIVFVDYVNRLRKGGMERHDALVATGKTRMRPILMTTMTTVLAMVQLIFGKDMGSQLGSGMAIVIAGGLAYATLMTLIIIPIMYDIFFKKPPLNVEIGGDLEEELDEAAEYLREKALGAEI